MRCLSFFLALPFMLWGVCMADSPYHGAVAYAGLRNYFVERFANSQGRGLMGYFTMRSQADTHVQTAPGHDKKSAKKSEKSRRLTMLDGRDIFMQYCMQCHLSSDQNAPQLAHDDDWSWRIRSGVDFLVSATIAGKPYQDAPPQGLLGQSIDQRYAVDDVQTVPSATEDSRERGCALPRGGCKDCSDAEIIAVVKYMMQASVTDNSNYSLW